MPVEVIESVTGTKYTNGDGYHFRLSQKLNGKLYLNCQVKTCRARGNIPEDVSKAEQIKLRGEHNHFPDHYESEFCELERRILERSAREPTSLRKIFLDETAQASPKTVVRLNYPTFIRRMQRRRQLNSLSTPSSLSDFAERLMTAEFADFALVNGQQFFIDAIENEAILFLSPSMREFLKWSNEVYTIYEVKKVFHPNLVKYVMILAKIHYNVAFPIAYIGLCSRTYTVYRDIFKKIQNEEPTWSPRLFFVNANGALKDAILQCFPKCKIAHSLFHLVQALRKEMTKLDLVNLLHSDTDFYSCLELLQALPLLPAPYMSTGLEIIKSRASSPGSQQGLSQLSNYVNANWLTGSSAVSLFHKSECMNLELKLLHRQLMSSFRENTRREPIWSFIKGLTLADKKYSDAFREITSHGMMLKWTGSCTFRNQEKKIRTAMIIMDSGKLIIESFLENAVKAGVSIMNLGDDDVQHTAEDEPYDSKPTAFDAELPETVDSSEELDPNDFIVEVEEEYLNVSSVECDETKPYSADIHGCSNSEANTQIGVMKIKYEPNGPESIPTSERPTSTKPLIFSASSPDLKCTSSNGAISHPCVLCTQKTYSYACQPCGHLCLCDLCCQDATKRNCPLCSKRILWVQEINLAYAL